MNESEFADLFNRHWDASQSGASLHGGGETPEAVRHALKMAGKVSRADFSADSRARDALRRRILMGEFSGGAASPTQPVKVTRPAKALPLAGWVRTAGYAAAIGLFLLVFSLTIRAFLPRSQPAVGMASPSAALSLLESPAASTEALTMAIDEATPTPQAPPPALGLESLPETIQAVILNPAWETLWVQGKAHGISPDGEPYTFHVQGWLDRDGIGRVISTDQLSGDVPYNADLEPRWVWASNGQTLLLYDHQSGEFDSNSEATRWFDHPLETAGVVIEMLFPRALEGSVESMQVIEHAVQAGRPAVVIDWEGARYWIDSETGVILRRQQFDESGNVTEDIAIDAIVYNPTLPEDITDSDQIESAPFEAAPTSQPGDIPSSPPASQPGELPDNLLETPTATPTPAASDTIVLSIPDDQSGVVSSDAFKPSLYFTLRSVLPPFDRQLARVDSACLFTQSGCQIDLIPGLPENFDNLLHWAPDGSQAVLIDSANSRVLLFDPRSGSFSTLADNLMVTTDMVFWSPDGAWVALTVENEQKDGSLITLINPTVTSSRNDYQTLTADLAGIQMPLAWLDKNTLLFFRHSIKNKDGSGQFIEPGLYRLDLQRSLVSEVPFNGGWEWLKNYPAASPDGAQLAVWTELDGQRQLAVLDFGDISLSGSLITPLGMDGSTPTWSPDGNWIAFTAPGVDPAGEPVVQVNVIHPDGSGLQTLFTWGSTPSMAWAPDSQRLIITAWPLGEDPEHDRTTFYLANIAEGKLQHILMDDAHRQYELISPAFRPPE